MDWPEFIMFMIPWLISFFVGICAHEYGHKLFCNLLGVRVLQVKYFSFPNRDENGEGVLGWVVHDPPKYLYQAVFITLGPIITNSILLVLVLLIVRQLPLTIPFIVVYAISSGILSSLFPSMPDIDGLLEHLIDKELPLFFEILGKCFCYILKFLSWSFVPIIFGLSISTLMMQISTNIVDTQPMPTNSTNNPDANWEYQLNASCTKICVSEYGNSKGYYRDNPLKEVESIVNPIYLGKYRCTCYNADKTDYIQIDTE